MERRRQYSGLTIAAIVPCHNEEQTVVKVIDDLAAAVPGMDIYVYDNNSTDRTAELARAATAETSSYRPGHGPGTRTFNRLAGGLINEHVSDMFSGYHAMSLRLPTADPTVSFRHRPEGRESTLGPYSDGSRIPWVILPLLQVERPNLFHRAIVTLLMLASLGLVPQGRSGGTAGDKPRVGHV